MYTQNTSGPKTGSKTGFQHTAVSANLEKIRRQGLLIRERIDEILMMCDRDDPVYEQISSFGIGLYTLGYFDCPDLMGVEDIDAGEAGKILQNDFLPVRAADIAADYNLLECPERYLLVVGDPLFPAHFAVPVDFQRQRPFFSKLAFFGSGFDRLSELMAEFSGIDGIGENDFQYFQKKPDGAVASASMGKIYIVK
ncbi:MAG: hypothetical protein KFF46_07735 [Desulfobacterales bacterium]|nr:hypothetical protein [Desulfobacterales bacterium]